jgi:hypothetical protein
MSEFAPELAGKTCPVCRKKFALWFAFRDGTFVCECGAEGDVSELVDREECDEFWGL